MDVANNPGPIPSTMDRFLGATRVAALGLVLILFFLVGRLLGTDFLLLSVTAAALLVGVMLPLVFLHPFRVIGLCPPAVLVVAACLVAVWASDDEPLWAVLPLCLACGIVGGVWLRTDVHSRIQRTIPLLDWLTLGIMSLGFPLLVSTMFWPSAADVKLGLLVFALVLVAYSWTRLFRPFFELCVEAVVWRGYRIAAAGDGLRQFPRRGPVLVIANHACWWDPLFLAKVLPRPITPMMTSAFYDRWFLKPLMVHVFQTIRVADVQIRREAPEIQQAIAALDEGKCVVIFPEGYLRRKEEVPLRRFGRGVWEILKARPQTPVVAGWIEGGWGSFASYFNGPPTKNKIKESGRLISVGVTPPLCVPAEVLQHHLQTRLTLMNAVSEAREQLGLPRLPAFEWKTNEEPEGPAHLSES